MRSAFVKIVTLSAALAVSLGTANAAIVSSTYAVTGSNFASTGVSPFTSITESFTITFDNTKFISQQTTGISLNPSTITPTSTLGFSYIPGADILTVGGLASTVATADPSSTDFALVINGASGNYGITALSYTDGKGIAYAATTTAKATTSVPEPASLALFGTAAGALALIRRRRTAP